jgi:hypothetical protein
MNKEIEFFIKVIRNALILAGLYFVSVWAASDTLSFSICKPVIIFLITYILTELTKRYGLDIQKNKKNFKCAKTLIL